MNTARYTTFRAAYIASAADSTSGGFVLTTEENAHLPDEDLMALAEKIASELGVDGEIVIGDWTE